MPGTTTFVKFKYAEAADEVNKFPAEVSEPGAKTIDKYLEEHTLSFKTYAGSATLKSGEWAFETKSGETFTLPAAATANQLIAVTCGPEGVSVKVTTSGGAFIYGDFIVKEATITVLANQHVLLISNGLNWFIIAGEPKREAKLTAAKAFTKVEAEAGFEASATRPALVYTTVAATKVGGVVPLTASPYWVNPGQKVEATSALEAQWMLL